MYLRLYIYISLPLSLCACAICMFFLHTVSPPFRRCHVAHSLALLNDERVVCIATARRCHMCVGFACLVCLLGAFVVVVIAAASSHTHPSASCVCVCVCVRVRWCAPALFVFWCAAPFLVHACASLLFLTLAAVSRRVGVGCLRVSPRWRCAWAGWLWVLCACVRACVCSHPVAAYSAPAR